MHSFAHDMMPLHACLDVDNGCSLLIVMHVVICGHTAHTQLRDLWRSSNSHARIHVSSGILPTAKRGFYQALLAASRQVRHAMAKRYLNSLSFA